MLIVSLSEVEDCYKHTSTSLSVTLIFRYLKSHFAIVYILNFWLALILTKNNILQQKKHGQHNSKKTNSSYSDAPVGVDCTDYPAANYNQPLFGR